MAYPRGISLALEMNSHRVFICLGLSAVAWPSTIGAQSLPAPAGTAQSPNVLAARTYSAWTLPTRWRAWSRPSRVGGRSTSCRRGRVQARASRRACRRSLRSRPDRKRTMPCSGDFPCSPGGPTTRHGTPGA